MKKTKKKKVGRRVSNELFKSIFEDKVLKEIERLEKKGIELEPIWERTEEGDEVLFGWAVAKTVKVADSPVIEIADAKIILWLPATIPKGVKK